MLQESKLIGHELIKSYIPDIPTLPGIYKMLGDDKQVIYVGKAKNLKKRLTNYIKADLDTKSLRLISATNDLEYNVTNSEVEALLLEAQLIKKFQPKFNILLKDDKSFPYIKLTLESDYPQLIKYRGKKVSDGKFFGPFVSSQQVDNSLKELQKIFKLRSCSDTYFKNRGRPCLQYQIGRCSAPCVQKITKEDYQESVEQVKKFFAGQTGQLQQLLSKKMEELSGQLRFEEAGEMRDRIKALSYIQLKSNVSNTNINNADIIAIVEKNNHYCIQLFVYRSGQFCGNIPYFPLHTEDSSKSEILSQFLLQFYQTAQIPEQIIINHPINDLEIITKAIRQISNNRLLAEFASGREFVGDTQPRPAAYGSSSEDSSLGSLLKLPAAVELCKKSNDKLTILEPTGNQVPLVDNAEINAGVAIEHHLKQFAKNQLIFEQMRQLFHLPSLPSRIEIYDNSHIMGSFAVGSMVVANNQGLDKKEYRIFNIDITQGDDYEMLRVVLTRRFTRLTKEPHKIPSLMIIDGGKGHLSVAQKIMHEFVFDIPLVGMAKGIDRNAGLEQFHINKEVFTLDKNLPVMKYLQILRDEAHNFAIKNHRLRRSQSIKISSLDDITAIGPARKKALLHYFGSYKAVVDATIDELSKVQGISKNIAKTIFTSVHNKLG